MGYMILCPDCGEPLNISIRDASQKNALLEGVCIKQHHFRLIYEVKAGDFTIAHNPADSKKIAIRL